MRVHETIALSEGVADSVRGTLERPLPDPVTATLEYATYLHAAHLTLGTMLAGTDDIRENLYLYDEDAALRPTPGAVRAATLRRALATAMLAHAEYLGDARVAQGPNGWTLLMATWAVVAQLVVCLARLDDPAAVDDDDDDETLAYNEMLTTPRGTANAPHMSLAELRLALDVFRDRIGTTVADVNPALVRYLRALELRAAEFACDVVGDADDYDDEYYVRAHADGTKTALAPTFIASMAWYFVWTKRYVRTYARMSRPTFFDTTLCPGRIVTTLATPLPARTRTLEPVLGAYVRTIDVTDHEQEFAKLARPYEAAPGDLEAHSFTYGMGGLEPSTVADVVSHRRTPDAAAYVATRKYRRSLKDWWAAGRRRAALTGTRTVGTEAWIDGPLTVLYIVNSLLVAKAHVPWARWFVVSVRGAGTDFEMRVRQGIAAGMPFLAQRLGRFACIVPPVPDDARARIEARLGLQEPTAIAVGTVMYDTVDVLDAVYVWARFMHDGWDGRVHHAPDVRLRPLLGALLGDQ